MGAIAGVVYPDAFQDSDLIRPMMDIMQYRCEGRYLHSVKTVQLGSGSPLFKGSKTHLIAVGLDGAIHNSQLLLDQLQRTGYQITSSDPTELIAFAYDKWGVDCLTKLEGEFALAILDYRRGQLLIARDRLGKKPLYWYQDNHHFLFASELKALLITGVVPQTPAFEALAAYLTLGYFPQDITPIQGINKLLPSYHLLYKINGPTSIHPYWSYSSYFHNKASPPAAEISANLQDLLERSIQQRLRTDSSIGCSVAGGLGSASVAYYLHKLVPERRITAFTIGFEKEHPDDLRAATEVCGALHIPQQVALVTPHHFVQDFVKIVWHLDEPIADPAVLSAWRLSRLAAATTNTLFTGMGCDELLAGHLRYTTRERLWQQSLLQKVIWQPLARHLLVPLFHRLGLDATFSLLRSAEANPAQSEYLRANEIFSARAISCAMPKLQGLFNNEVFLQKFLHLYRIKSRVASWLYLDVKTRLPDWYILKLDRITAAFGLQWETPYLNTELFQYLALFDLPDLLYEQDTAGYLQSNLRSHLPDSVIDKPKSSRQRVIRSWAMDPQVIEAFSLLQQGTLIDIGLLSPAWLKREIATCAWHPDSFKHLWALLTLEVWYRLFIGRTPPNTAPQMSVVDLLRE